MPARPSGKGAAWGIVRVPTRLPGFRHQNDRKEPKPRAGVTSVTKRPAGLSRGVVEGSSARPSWGSLPGGLIRVFAPTVPRPSALFPVKRNLGNVGGRGQVGTTQDGCSAPLEVVAVPGWEPRRRRLSGSRSCGARPGRRRSAQGGAVRLPTPARPSRTPRGAQRRGKKGVQPAGVREVREAIPGSGRGAASGWMDFWSRGACESPMGWCTVRARRRREVLADVRGPLSRPLTCRLWRARPFPAPRNTSGVSRPRCGRVAIVGGWLWEIRHQGAVGTTGGSEWGQGAPAGTETPRRFRGLEELSLERGRG